MLPFPDRRPESILVVINAVAFQFHVAERQRTLAARAQVNGRIIFVRDDLRENSAYLQARRILTGRNVLAFDGFVNAFKTSRLISHLAGKFFERSEEHTSEL